MKILCTSDWHLDWVSMGVSRFDEVSRAVDKTVEEAVRRRVDLYLFTGDLCDPDSGTSVFRCAAKAIEVAKRLAAEEIQSVWVVGNHDVLEDGSGDTTLTPLKETGYAVVFDKPAFMRVNSTTHLLALPFTASSHGYDPAAFVKEHRQFFEGPWIVAGHLMVPGVVPGEETLEMPRGRDVVFPIEECSGAALMINGHYHRRQKSPGGVVIPGSLARLTAGEQHHEPSFLVLEV